MLMSRAFWRCSMSLPTATWPCTGPVTLALIRSPCGLSSLMVPSRQWRMIVPLDVVEVVVVEVVDEVVEVGGAVVEVDTELVVDPVVTGLALLASSDSGTASVASASASMSCAGGQLDWGTGTVI